jgi:CubicO group peptidase (beta-lactamase class C family)
VNVFSLSGKEELTLDNVESFFSNQIPLLMEKYNLVGFTMAFGLDNEIITRGYGFSDLEKQISVDPENTLFRAGSISKLFTWTAIMQLVEQEEIDLNADINNYLGNLQIPETYSQPITMLHLMSHTPGFEDIMIGLFTKDWNRQESLYESLKKRMLKRVRLPGKEVSYSNYGTMLAGYIIEQINGISYEEYIEQNILKPLEMNMTTFRQPVPDNMKNQLSKGYTYSPKGYQQMDFEIVQGAPAGSISVTAEDMIKFFNAHLGTSGQEGISILKPKTMELMHTPHYQPDPRSSGFAHGFFYSRHKDFTTLTHGGDTIYFHSYGGIIPEYNFSFFFSNNTSTGSLANMELQSKLLDTFFPEPKGDELSNNYISTSNLNKYEDTYLVNRHSESDFSKLMKLGMTVSVKVSPDGGLDITDFTRSTKPYVEIDKNIFQEVDGTNRMIFFENEKGEINSVMMDIIPAFLFNKMSLSENSLLNALIVLFLIVTILFCFISAPTGIIAQFKKKYHKDKLSWLASTNALILIINYFLFFTVLIAFFSSDFIFNLPNIAIAIFPYVLLILTLGMSVFTVITWLKKWWRLPGRIIYTTLTVSSILFQCFSLVWKFF